MRTPIEALQEVRSRMVYFCGRTDGKYDPPWAEEIVGICDDIVKDAIAEPPRNCDVYTADKLKVIFNSELVSELPIANEHQKNLISITAMTVIDTLLAPATTKEGGDDGK